MEDITYSQSKLDEITENFNVAHNNADSLKQEIISAISTIKENWVGTDDVVAQRDIDFKKILENMDVICNNLASTTKYLSEKNANFAAASINYKSG